MKSVIKARLYLGLTAAILLVIIVGVISYRTFRQQNFETANIKHSYKVLNQLAYTEKLFINMETGKRGFRSTNEKKFLEPYNVSYPKVEPAINDLRNLLSDAPNQTLNLTALNKAADSLLAFWLAMPSVKETYAQQEILQINETEKVKMDAVRAAIERLTISEKKLLQQREKDNESSVNEAVWELLIGIVLIVAIVLILVNLILKEFKSREKAEEDLQLNNVQLEAAHKESTERNWLLSGLAEVNNSLQGSEDVDLLTQPVLNTIVRYLSLPAGAFYVYDDEDKLLYLTAANALPAAIPKQFQLHEGLIGQAALAEEPVIIKNLPQDFTSISSGTINAKPAEVMYAPVRHHKELKGVIELLSFQSFTNQQTNFIKAAGENIGVALHSAQAREKVMMLLEQVQQQTEVLEQQQEELRQANEELSLQTETLQASEEELKVQEEELRQINSELEEKNASVETARQAMLLKTKELEVTGKYKSEFLANMSHELRTPLNSVLILAKLLAENKTSNLTEKQMEHARIIHKSGFDLLNLINDILDLSKIEAGKIDLNIEQVPIKSIANDVQELFAPVADEKEIEFKVKIDPDVPYSISTDKQKVEQIIKNLLSNAFKFTAPNGFVNLSFSCITIGKENILKIAVSDTGIGIVKEKHQVIFEAFQQADMSTNRKYGGTGLGLSITKELLKLLKGTIELDSEVRKGSTFTISLPFSKIDNELLSNNDQPDEVENEAAYNERKVKDDRSSIQPNDPVILIVEDDEDFAVILKSIAYEHGYKVIIALKGDEGLQYARKYKPSAIILDMNLPVMDGGMVLKKLKSIDELKHIPVHIISGTEENKFVIPGAFAYLKKPVKKQDIENVFASLDGVANKAIKKVLLITEDNLKDNNLQQLIFSRQLDIKGDYVISVPEALKKMEVKNYDCVIADIGSDVEKGIKDLKALNPGIKNIPVIVYVDTDISSDMELQLKKVSNAVVRNSNLSSERLMDEMELFLYKVKQADSSPHSTPVITTTNGTDGTLEGKKVLVVDDDMRNVFALTELLEQEQMEIYTASDGREALDNLTENKNIDIVLMDIMMPEMDGYEAIKHIRSQMRLTELPIIALTAKAMPGDREKCMEAGASDYITKPVDNQKLQSLMRVWLSK